MIIHFIRPHWFLALIPIIIYLLWVIYSHREHNPWKSCCDPHLLPALLQKTPKNTRWLFNLILFLFFTLSIFALAGPSWQKIKIPIYRDMNSLMVVLDLSTKMADADLNPDRLTRAKFKIRDLINASPNTQMGLVVFTAEAFVVSPLSQDANTLKSLLDELHPDMMPVSGASIDQGLKKGLALLEQAGVGESNLLLITASTPTDESLIIAKKIAQTKNHIQVLAMLPENAANKATIEKLKELAQLGDGSFFLFRTDAKDTEAILTLHHTNQAFQDKKQDAAYLWQDAGPFFSLLLIPVALIVLREKIQHEKRH